MLESEQLTSLLNQYLREMSAIALEYGATIDKFIGDAIMLFFGDPETSGERKDARRLRQDGDRHAAAHARPAGRMARAGPGARVPAPHRHQHRLLHGRQFRQRRPRRLHHHRQRGESGGPPAIARRPRRHPARPRDLFAGQGRGAHRGDRHHHGQGLRRPVRTHRVVGLHDKTSGARPHHPAGAGRPAPDHRQEEAHDDGRADAIRVLQDAVQRLQD